MLLLTLLAVLVAQGFPACSGCRTCSSQREGLLTSSRSLAYSMAASVSYFRSLPLGYLLVLDQLRSMGGLRASSSLNDRPLEMRALPDTPNKRPGGAGRSRTCCINAWARRSSCRSNSSVPTSCACSTAR